MGSGSACMEQTGTSRSCPSRASPTGSRAARGRSARRPRRPGRRRGRPRALLSMDEPRKRFAAKMSWPDIFTDVVGVLRVSKSCCACPANSVTVIGCRHYGSVCGERLFEYLDHLEAGPLGVLQKITLLPVAVLVRGGNPAVDRYPPPTWRAPVFVYQLNPLGFGIL